MQYLWIDSLCIIQDDVRDWQIESSKMAEIFSNAYLTLVAASGSGGCNDSFLSKTLPNLSCTVPFSIDAGFGDSVDGKFSFRSRRRSGGTEKMSDIGESRWITRGWTFQEERLARRVLMFGENKFFFDCRTKERVEGSDLYQTRPDWVTSVADGPDEYQAENPDSTEQSQSWDHWQTLCSHYAYRELTFPEDKLPAISGMAKKIARRIQAPYLAGLWQNNLKHDLFWKTVGVATKPHKYRAPSWSWASLDGNINWWSWRFCTSEAADCSLLCTILEARTTPVGLDPYGAVKDGYLKIQGWIQDVELVWVGDDKSHHPWRLTCDGDEIAKVNLDIESEDMKAQDRRNTFKALTITKCESRKRKKILIRGLILKKTGRQRGMCNEFERIGTFTLLSSLPPTDDDTKDVIIIV